MLLPLLEILFVWKLQWQSQHITEQSNILIKRIVKMQVYLAMGESRLYSLLKEFNNILQSRRHFDRRKEHWVWMEGRER